MADSENKPSTRDTFRKLAPFARRAGIAVTGRARLKQMRKQLEFVLMTAEISAKSERDLRQSFPCPVIKAMTSEMLERHLGFRGTKVVGFTRSALARSLYRACRDDAERTSDS